MASRAVTVTTCDLCGVRVDEDNAPRNDGRPLDLRLVVDGVEHVVDLCNAHDVELLTVLRWHGAGYAPDAAVSRDLTARPRQRRSHGRARASSTA